MPALSRSQAFSPALTGGAFFFGVSSRVRPERADLGTFDQKFGGDYQDRNRASSLDSRPPGQMAGGPGGKDRSREEEDKHDFKHGLER